jgi:hypothetical protein
MQLLKLNVYAVTWQSESVVTNLLRGKPTRYTLRSLLVVQAVVEGWNFFTVFTKARF